MWTCMFFCKLRSPLRSTRNVGEFGQSHQQYQAKLTIRRTNETSRQFLASYAFSVQYHDCMKFDRLVMDVSNPDKVTSRLQSWQSDFLVLLPLLNPWLVSLFICLPVYQIKPWTKDWNLANVSDIKYTCIKWKKDGPNDPYFGLGCKIQRRKCDRPTEDVDCSRCIKSNRECFNDDGGQDGEDDSVDGNMELQRLTAQVTSLQQNFQHLENHLLRSDTSSQNMVWEETALASWNHRHHSDNDLQSTSSSYSQLLLSPTLTACSSASVSSGSTINNGSMASINNDGKNKNTDYQWDLTLVGGNLRLDSAIGSFEELIAYGHALQKYLSPFSGVFDNTAFLFETMQPQSILPMVIQVVSLTSPTTTQRKRLIGGTSMINKYHFMLKRRLPEVLLAAAGKPPPLSCIQHLLQTYFTCFNPAFPLIHASSYYAEYASVIRHDPSQHALTMAVCSMVSISTCRHVVYDNYERRILADYFYQRAVDLLVDFFDDSERRLESLMVINFISQYQQQTLRVADARKWCTIAFMIATDLEQEYKLHQRSAASSPPSPNAPSTPASSPILSYPSPFLPSPLMSSIPLSPPASEPALPSKLVQTTQNVDAAIFGRHYIMSLCCQKFLDLIVEGNPETWQFLNSKPLLFIEDECDVSYTFIAFYNCALQFMCHPVVLEMKVIHVQCCLHHNRILTPCPNSVQHRNKYIDYI